LGTSSEELQLTILMPVRDDWAAATELLRRLGRALDQLQCSAQVLVVDDLSETAWLPSPSGLGDRIKAVHSLRLRRNLGHQRAIAIGLAYVEQHIPCDAVLVMDADGEDTPEGAAQLLQAYLRAAGTATVFAARTRRAESLTFQLGYQLFKIVHLLLTGIPVRIGNFSVMPREHLRTAVVMSELWNHYAATMVRSKLPLRMEPIPRGQRIAGHSSMNLVGLVTHGLSAISVFSDIVGTRLLILTLLAAVLSLLVLPYTGGIVFLAALQFIAIATSFHFFLLSNRSAAGFIPTRDYAVFVDAVTEVYRA
jgi:hypothetical protein